MFSELRGTNHDSNKKQIKCKAGAMISTRNGMYKSSFPHYTIDVRRSLPRSAVDARAQGLHLTASPVPHPKDKDTNHRYAKHWRSFLVAMDQLGRTWPAAVTGCGRGSTAILLCQFHCLHGSNIFGILRFVLLGSATHPCLIGTCRHLIRKKSAMSTKTDLGRH